MSVDGVGEVTLIVIAKEPLPGRCKTRLCPPLRPADAARLAEAALADTLAAVRRARARRWVIALDGTPGRWMPNDFEVIPQSTGGLDARLAAAFEAVRGPALLVGMDTPQISAKAVEAAAAALMGDRVDAVLGPATDGGYWAIGLRRACREVFEGVAMSTPRTANLQRRRLRELGLRFTELETMRDVDTIADAQAVAAICPGSGFARTLTVLPWAAAA